MDRDRGPTTGRLGRLEWLALIAGLIVAVGIRLVLLPWPGLAGDVGDFLSWAQWIQANGLGRAYEREISFPAVLPWIWWLIGTIWPPLGSATATDPAALSLMKLPAVLADFGLAAIVGFALRQRPLWAVAGALAVLFQPAGWYISAWWAQLDSLYVLPLAGAWLLLATGRGRPVWAAVAIAIAMMTKPQAWPLAMPFAAYYLRRYDGATVVRAALAGAITSAVAWLPFMANGGIDRYVSNFLGYSDLFSVISLRAWNPWWLITEAVGRGGLVADDFAISGPVTFRWFGYAIATVLELLVFVEIWRRPTPTRLAWGLAAATLAAFIGLTQMHERYSYPILVFLVLAWPNRLALASWVAAALAVSLNIVAAVPPSGGPGSIIPVDGALGAVGSIAVVAVFVATLVGLRTADETDELDEPAGGGGSGEAVPAT